MNFGCIEIETILFTLSNILHIIVIVIIIISWENESILIELRIKHLDIFRLKEEIEIYERYELISTDAYVCIGHIYFGYQKKEHFFVFSAVCTFDMAAYLCVCNSLKLMTGEKRSENASNLNKKKRDFDTIHSIYDDLIAFSVVRLCCFCYFASVPFVFKHNEERKKPATKHTCIHTHAQFLFAAMNNINSKPVILYLKCFGLRICLRIEF